MEDFLYQLMGSPAGAVLRVGVRILAPAAVLMAFLRIKRLERPSSGGRSLSVRAIPALLFGALLVYQASWQLTGSFRPGFMAFMQRHSPRPDSPDKRLQRGRILAADGVVLAGDHPEIPGRRVYPLGPAASHVVGYVDSRFGLSGVESVADGRLSGYAITGMEDFERIARSVVGRRSLSGGDVRLTLDSRLQRKAFSLLAGKSGAVVAIDPRDGSILAMASSPGFDPSDVGAALHQPRSPMLNRALQGLYPPGSAFKIVTAAMALESGVPLVYDCPAQGYSPAPGVRPIRDHAYYAAQREGRAWRGFGKLNLEQAFSRSSNTYFAQLGVRIDPQRFENTVEKWGLRNAWSILAGEFGSLDSKPGSVPVSGKTGVAERAQLAIGQGRMVLTPLHVALAASIVANEGVLVPPRLSADAPPTAGKRVCRLETARELNRLMRSVVLSGTARAANLPGLEVAGKTGTAQVGHGEDHAWFVCLAPASAPRIVLAVVVEHGGYGAAAALPLAVELLQLAHHLGVPEAELKKAGTSP